MDPFITTAELAELQETVDQGKATIQAYRNPPTLTLRRRSTTTEQFVTVATFRPIKIDLASRLEQVSGANTGRVTTTQGGAMEVEGSLTIRRDDRFILDGVTCRVTLSRPETNLFGYRIVEFDYVGG